MLQGKVASLELDKVRHVGKIVMLEHGMQKFKGELGASSLKNINFQTSVTRQSGQVCKVDEDMKWVLSEGVEKVVDKLFADSSFYDANRDLHTICIEFGMRQGCKMMNNKHCLGLTK